MRRSVVLAVFAVCLPQLGFAQTNEPKWISDSITGCRVWDYLQPNGLFRWTGSCQNGMAQGPGSLRWFKDGKPNGVYEGVWQDGKLTGRAVVVTGDGSLYVGEWRDGQPNGHGIWDFQSGIRYEGDLHDGTVTGFGVATALNGGRYEGQWRDGMPNGEGHLVAPDGSVYDGMWINGCFKDGKKVAGVGIEPSSCH
jgi:hypothetical protein